MYYIHIFFLKSSVTTIKSHGLRYKVQYNHQLKNPSTTYGQNKLYHCICSTR